MTWREVSALLLAWVWWPVWMAWQQAVLLGGSAMPTIVRASQDPLAQPAQAALVTGTVTALPPVPLGLRLLGLATWLLYVLALLSPLLALASFRQRGRWAFKSAYLTGLCVLALFSLLWFGSMSGPIGW